MLDYLRSKRMLLILDNFEHLSVGVSFVNQIIHTAPHTKILVTSRTTLSIVGEHIYDVMGMAYPKAFEQDKTAARQYSAVRLFESAAKRRQSSFELSDKNIPDVVHICTLLEGMPLGIVLAAIWVTMLSPEEIVWEIEQDLAFLDTELHDLPRRQRSIRSVFNHSWRLLGEGEQKIMAALSVFRGGFTREAAQEVAGAALIDLKGLIDQSMLHNITSGRYEVHELLRQYAAEKLRMDPAMEADIWEKYSAYYCQALAGWEHDFNTFRKGEAMLEMTVEIDNIRPAWNWAVRKIRSSSLMSGLRGLCRFYAENISF